MLEIEIKPKSIIDRLAGRDAVHFACLTWVCLRLSPLKQHLFTFDFNQSPLFENCQITDQSTVHYFLHWPAYCVQETFLLINLCNTVQFEILSRLQDEENPIECLL